MTRRTSNDVSTPLPELFQIYRGKWVALDKHGSRILASADDLDTLEHQLVTAGEDPEEVLFDRIEDEDVMVGGAEIV